MHKHLTVKAADLRRGDLLRLGDSTNYVLVASAELNTDGYVAVTLYHGSEPEPGGHPTLVYRAETPLSLSMRDCQP